MRNGIGPVPTSSKVKKLLLARAPLQSPIIELGAGWGTLLIPLAKQHSLVIGYENSWIPYLYLKLRTLRKKNVILVRKDFWKEELTQKGTIIAYLSHKLMPQLEKKLEEHQGLVVTHTFCIPGWTPSAIHQADDLYKSTIYIYNERRNINIS